MNTVAVRAPNTSAKAAWICLAIAWVCFIVPVPGLGLFVGWPLNLVAFILAIVAMSKGGAMSGLFQLLGSLIASPVIYFIGLAVFAGTMSAVGEAGNARQVEAVPVADVVADAPLITVTARELQSAYASNEIAADQDYKGKAFRVSGTIETISSDFSDEPVIQLTAADFNSVHLKGIPKEVAAGLGKGQKVTASCTGAGEVIGSPMLEDCVID